jgi:hypothetical protein
MINPANARRMLDAEVSNLVSTEEASAFDALRTIASAEYIVQQAAAPDGVSDQINYEPSVVVRDKAATLADISTRVVAHAGTITDRVASGPMKTRRSGIDGRASRIVATHSVDRILQGYF